MPSSARLLAAAAVMLALTGCTSSGESAAQQDARAASFGATRCVPGACLDLTAAAGTDAAID